MMRKRFRLDFLNIGIELRPVNNIFTDGYDIIRISYF